MAQKTYETLLVKFLGGTEVTDAIAAWLDELEVDEIGVVEKITAVDINPNDQNNPYVQILMSKEVQDNSEGFISLGTQKMTGIETPNVTARWIAPFDGKIVKGYSRVSADPGATNTMSLKVNGGTAATATIVVATGGSAWDLDSADFANNNVVVAGDRIELITDGGGSNATDAYVNLIMQKIPAA
jgi:hypothetical protein